MEEKTFLTPVARGLCQEEVEQRISEGRKNDKVEDPGKTLGQIIAGHTFTYFNLIFAVLAVLVILVRSYQSLTFLVAVIFNLLIGIVQEIRAKQILSKVQILDAKHAQVIRDGKKQDIAAEELVEDDLILFSSGMQIPADALVRTGSVKVNEALLTGESDEITKEQGDELLSGSFIVSGECVAQVTKVGADSYISKLTLEAKASKGVGQSEMVRDINRLIKVIGILLIPIGVFMAFKSYVILGSSLKESIVSMTAALVGMVPEGLYLLTTLRLLLSTASLAKKKILIHEMSCMEALARVDVLCVDKTGTITSPDMQVMGCYPVAEGTETDITDLMTDFAAAMANDNATMKAVKTFFDGEARQQPEQVVPFSSVSKYSAVQFSNGWYVLGAAEMVLREQYDGTVKERIEQYAKEGKRALLLARYHGTVTGASLTGKAEPLAYVVLENQIRPSAKETFAYFEKQGVAIKVISGDNPLTVSNVALEAGISDAERYVDASSLETKEQMKKALQECAVFGRVTPEQKRTFVHLLKEQGHCVAMTGDGVNDVLALKDADCSIAMASGSEAATHTAQLVLLDSDFSKMPHVVLEGRRVVNNLARSASLFLIKNIFSIVIAVLSIFFLFEYPVRPSQMSMISGLAIGFPAFMMALEKNTKRIEGRFLANAVLEALPSALTNIILGIAMVVGGSIFSVPDEQLHTAVTILLMTVGVLTIGLISKPFTYYRLAIMLLVLAAAVFSFTVLHVIFETVVVRGATLFLLLLCLLLILPILFSIYRLEWFLIFRIRAWRMKRKQENA